jgi:Flp pilus assembly protein TadD
MPRHPIARSRARAREQPVPRASATSSRKRLKWILTGLSILVALATVAQLFSRSPSRLRAEAERAAQAGDWSEALKAWRAFNATSAAQGATHLAEARAALALGYAGQAEQSLRKAIAADPADPEAWKLLLEILWVEDRVLDAQQVVWASYDQMPAAIRRDVLRELTLALLADVPDESVRTALQHWIAADPADVEARVALLQRIASQPRAGDPDRPSRLAELENLVAEHPKHLGARAALVATLADAYEPDRGRAVLDGWPGPESDRDARYWQLRGRWELEYDRHPDRAESAFRRALETMPQDWRTWFRLARALRQLGRDAEAQRTAEVVARIREALDPTTLGPRLENDFRHLDDPRALRDLAALGAQARLSRLAEAWRALAENPAQATVEPREHEDRRQEPAPTGRP